MSNKNEVSQRSDEVLLDPIDPLTIAGVILSGISAVTAIYATIEIYRKKREERELRERLERQIIEDKRIFRRSLYLARHSFSELRGSMGIVEEILKEDVRRIYDGNVGYGTFAVVTTVPRAETLQLAVPKIGSIISSILENMIKIQKVLSYYPTREAALNIDVLTGQLDNIRRALNEIGSMMYSSDISEYVITDRIWDQLNSAVEESNNFFDELESKIDELIL